MTSGYKSAGVDLDNIFLPFSSGTPAAPTGYKVVGVDFSDRLQPYESGPKAAPTGYKVGGVDFCDLFAIEIPPTEGPVEPGFGGEYNATTVRSHDAAAGLTLTIAADGTWTITRSGGGGILGSPLSGTWHSAPAAGVGADCQIRIDVDGVQGAWGSLAEGSGYTASAFASYPGNPEDSDRAELVINIRRNNGSGLVSEPVVLVASASAF